MRYRRGGAQHVQEPQVRPHGGGSVVGIGDVLAQVVDAEVAARIPQRGNDIHHVVERVAGHEPAHHPAGERRALDDAAQPIRAAGGKHCRAQRVREPAGHQSTAMCG